MTSECFIDFFCLFILSCSVRFALISSKNTLTENKLNAHKHSFAFQSCAFSIFTMVWQHRKIGRIPYDESQESDSMICIDDNWWKWREKVDKIKTYEKSTEQETEIIFKVKSEIVRCKVFAFLQCFFLSDVLDQFFTGFHRTSQPKRLNSSQKPIQTQFGSTNIKHIEIYDLWVKSIYSTKSIFQYKDQENKEARACSWMNMKENLTQKKRITNNRNTDQTRAAYEICHILW